MAAGPTDATTRPDSLLEVEHLRVEFPTRRGTLVAVDDVSFDIGEGEVLGVVGESGAGKSLTGAAIIGLLEPPGRIARRRGPPRWRADRQPALRASCARSAASASAWSSRTR